jgi:hypothetical protein
MHARYYHAGLARFTQADTIVPEPGNPQDLNRFAYTRNNPVLYVDPSGHRAGPPLVDGICAPGTCNSAFGPKLPLWFTNRAKAYYEDPWFDPSNPKEFGRMIRAVARDARKDGLISGDTSFEWNMIGLSIELSDPYTQIYIQTQALVTAGMQGTVLSSMPMDPDAYWGISSQYWAPETAETIAGYGPFNLGDSTTVHWPSKPHGVAEHWSTIRQEVNGLVASGRYSEVYVNKSLSTGTGGQVQSGLRPDILAKTPTGDYKIIEVVSPSQTQAQLQIKMDTMIGMFGGLSVDGTVIEP